MTTISYGVWTAYVPDVPSEPPYPNRADGQSDQDYAAALIQWTAGVERVRALARRVASGEVFLRNEAGADWSDTVQTLPIGPLYAVVRDGVADVVDASPITLHPRDAELISTTGPLRRGDARPI